MNAPAAPTTTDGFPGTTENFAGNGHSALSGYPVAAPYPAPNGFAGGGFRGYGYPAGPMASAPAPVAPAAAPQSHTGTPWFIAGATLWAIAVTQLMLLPHWLATKTTDGVVGNLTGVLALTGIGAALLAAGFARRRQNR